MYSDKDMKTWCRLLSVKFLFKVERRRKKQWTDKEGHRDVQFALVAEGAAGGSCQMLAFHRKVHTYM